MDKPRLDLTWANEVGAPIEDAQTHRVYTAERFIAFGVVSF